MIQRISSFEGYETFIEQMAGDPLYSDPHFTYDKDNLYGSLTGKDEYAFAVIEDGTTEGLFVWLVIPEERYIEMLIGFTSKEEAFSEMLSYLEKNYRGYDMDFVFNPKNTAIYGPLKDKGAEFYPEQQTLVLTGPVPDVSTSHIELLSEKWEKQYRELHKTDTYWTAERILAARDVFRVLLAVKDGQVQGYLDITCNREDNEIYDLFVKPESANQGYELALIIKAIELNGTHQMNVVTDADDETVTGIYTAAGFDKVDGLNSITASFKS